MKLSHVLTALACLVLTVMTTGCGLSRNQYPVERVVQADNERFLWDSLRLAIYESDFKVGGGADPSTRQINSAWKLDLAPYKGQGYRTRVLASYQPTRETREDGLESFAISIRVEKELNDSFKSLDLEYAKWKPADDDANAAKAILQRFMGYLGTDRIDIQEDKGAEDELGFDFDRR